MALQLLKRAILHARKHGLRVHHYSMQTNHIHLIVEANDNKTLSTGMRSLTVTFGKGIRKGRIQIERYHLHVLKTLREAKNALRYVLLNEQKHSKGQTLKVDSYSTLTNLGYEFIKEWMRKEKLGLIWNPEEQVSSLEMKSSWLLLEAHNQLVL
jgi:REP element-mobilizing transposase RayT